MSKLTFDKVFQFCVYAVLAVILVIMVYPLWFVIIASISDPKYVDIGQVILLPKGLNLEGYKVFLQTEDLMLGYKNTIIYTVVGTTINLLVLIPASFSLSRKEMPYRNFLMIFFLITMYVSGGLVPTFLQVRDLGLMNTMWALVLPGAFSVYNMIICRNYFDSNVSEELFDASRIDGTSYTGFFLKVVLPLSKPILAVMVLFHALGHWNSYLNALYYLSDRTKYPLQLVLKNMQDLFEKAVRDGETITEEAKMRMSMKYAIVLMSSLPVAMIYPFVQKYFVKGVMMGSIKG